MVPQNVVVFLFSFCLDSQSEHVHKTLTSNCLWVPKMDKDHSAHPSDVAHLPSVNICSMSQLILNHIIMTWSEEIDTNLMAVRYVGYSMKLQSAAG